MKKFIFIAIILLCTSGLYAQKDSNFYRHEVKMSISDGFVASIFWTIEGNRENSAVLFANISFSYFYRPVKWFWIGGNFANYIGHKISYDWREYYPDGRYRD